MKRTCQAGGLAAVVLALTPAPSPAPVPPRDCGFMKVSGTKYNVKADRLRCDPAREYTRAYIKRGAKPKGFRCDDYGSETSIRFRCYKGSKEFFAIRR